MNVSQVIAIARAAHEANRAFCIATGDTSQLSWDDAPEWQRTSAIDGLRTALAGAGPREQHDAWCTFKVADGWSYGPMKDAAAKTHPCLVPYDDLPTAQKVKDSIYIGVVNAMASAFRKLEAGT